MTTATPAEPHIIGPFVIDPLCDFRTLPDCKVFAQYIQRTGSDIIRILMIPLLQIVYRRDYGLSLRQWPGNCVAFSPGSRISSGAERIVTHEARNNTEMEATA
ncbi:MAG: hypothetical protein ABGZ35_10890 [Planctomycetaceae bacterium]